MKLCVGCPAPHQCAEATECCFAGYEAAKGKRKPIKVRDVAKVIDPGAFYEPDDITPTERSMWHEYSPGRQQVAIAKAREIQKLLNK